MEFVATSGIEQRVYPGPVARPSWVSGRVRVESGGSRAGLSIRRDVWSRSDRHIVHPARESKPPDVTIQCCEYWQCQKCQKCQEMPNVKIGNEREAGKRKLEAGSGKLPWNSP
jgi:hypothetical protein